MVRRKDLLDKIWMGGAKNPFDRQIEVDQVSQAVHLLQQMEVTRPLKGASSFEQPMLGRDFWNSAHDEKRKYKVLGLDLPGKFTKYMSLLFYPCYTSIFKRNGLSLKKMVIQVNDKKTIFY